MMLKTPPKAKGESDVDYESKLVSVIGYIIALHLLSLMRYLLLTFF